MESESDKSPCPGCEKYFKLDQLQDHLVQCDENKCCPYQALGSCKFNPLTDGTVIQHIQTRHNYDTALLASTLTVMETNKRLKKDNEKYENELKEMNEKLENMANTLEYYKKMVVTANVTIQEKNKRIAADANHIRQLTQRHGLLFSEAKYDERIKKIENLLGSSNQSLTTYVQSPMDFEKLNKTEKLVEKLEQQQAVLNANLADTDLKMVLLEGLSTDGHQLWKIDNFQYRLEQAKSGKIYALHSPPCYTKINGYKFCIRAYLNGDGLGKGTHLSIYFVLMKNHYDNLLDWPFHKKITFRLLNLKDNKQCRIESFTTDRHSSSFKQPEKEMNIAAGCPKFLRQDLITHGYLVDDSIIIETKVEDVMAETHLLDFKRSQNK